MDGILGHLDIRSLDNGRWVVLSDFQFFVRWPIQHSEDHEFRVRIPAGFETDLASIPWYARWVISPSGRLAKPAVIHDKLFRAPVITSDYTSQSVSFEGVNLIFLNAMQAAGVDPVRRHLVYQAVSLGGRAIWDRERSSS